MTSPHSGGSKDGFSGSVVNVCDKSCPGKHNDGDGSFPPLMHPNLNQVKDQSLIAPQTCIPAKLMQAFERVWDTTGAKLRRTENLHGEAPVKCECFQRRPLPSPGDCSEKVRRFLCVVARLSSKGPSYMAAELLQLGYPPILRDSRMTESELVAELKWVNDILEWDGIGKIEEAISHAPWSQELISIATLIHRRSFCDNRYMAIAGWSDQVPQHVSRHLRSITHRPDPPTSSEEKALLKRILQWDGRGDIVTSFPDICWSHDLLAMAAVLHNRSFDGCDIVGEFATPSSCSCFTSPCMIRAAHDERVTEDIRRILQKIHPHMTLPVSKEFAGDGKKVLCAGEAELNQVFEEATSRKLTHPQHTLLALLKAEGDLRPVRLSPHTSDPCALSSLLPYSEAGQPITRRCVGPECICRSGDLCVSSILRDVAKKICIRAPGLQFGKPDLTTEWGVLDECFSHPPSIEKWVALRYLLSLYPKCLLLTRFIAHLETKVPKLRVHDTECLKILLDKAPQCMEIPRLLQYLPKEYKLHASQEEMLNVGRRNTTGLSVVGMPTMGGKTTALSFISDRARKMSFIWLPSSYVALAFFNPASIYIEETGRFQVSEGLCPSSVWLACPSSMGACRNGHTCGESQCPYGHSNSLRSASLSPAEQIFWLLRWHDFLRAMSTIDAEEEQLLKGKNALAQQEQRDRFAHLLEDVETVLREAGDKHKLLIERLKGKNSTTDANWRRASEVDWRETDADWRRAASVEDEQEKTKLAEQEKVAERAKLIEEANGAADAVLEATRRKKEIEKRSSDYQSQRLSDAATRAFARRRKEAETSLTRPPSPLEVLKFVTTFPSSTQRLDFDLDAQCSTSLRFWKFVCEHFDGLRRRHEQALCTGRYTFKFSEAKELDYLFGRSLIKRVIFVGIHGFGDLLRFASSLHKKAPLVAIDDPGANLETREGLWSFLDALGEIRKQGIILSANHDKLVPLLPSDITVHPPVLASGVSTLPPRNLVIDGRVTSFLGLWLTLRRQGSAEFEELQKNNDFQCYFPPALFLRLVILAQERLGDQLEGITDIVAQIQHQPESLIPKCGHFYHMVKKFINLLPSIPDDVMEALAEVSLPYRRPAEHKGKEAVVFDDLSDLDEGDVRATKDLDQAFVEANAAAEAAFKLASKQQRKKRDAKLTVDDMDEEVELTDDVSLKLTQLKKLEKLSAADGFDLKFRLACHRIGVENDPLSRTIVGIIGKPVRVVAIKRSDAYLGTNADLSVLTIKCNPLRLYVLFQLMARVGRLGDEATIVMTREYLDRTAHDPSDNFTDNVKKAYQLFKLGRPRRAARLIARRVFAWYQVILARRGRSAQVIIRFMRARRRSEVVGRRVKPEVGSSSHEEDMSAWDDVTPERQREILEQRRLEAEQRRLEAEQRRLEAEQRRREAEQLRLEAEQRQREAAELERMRAEEAEQRDAEVVSVALQFTMGMGLGLSMQVWQKILDLLTQGGSSFTLWQSNDPLVGIFVPMCVGHAKKLEGVTWPLRCNGQDLGDLFLGPRVMEWVGTDEKPINFTLDPGTQIVVHGLTSLMLMPSSFRHSMETKLVYPGGCSDDAGMLASGLITDACRKQSSWFKDGYVTLVGEACGYYPQTHFQVNAVVLKPLPAEEFIGVLATVKSVTRTLRNELRKTGMMSTTKGNGCVVTSDGLESRIRAHQASFCAWASKHLDSIMESVSPTVATEELRDRLVNEVEYALGVCLQHAAENVKLTGVIKTLQDRLADLKMLLATVDGHNLRLKQLKDNPVLQAFDTARSSFDSAYASNEQGLAGLIAQVCAAFGDATIVASELVHCSEEASFKWKSAQRAFSFVELRATAALQLTPEYCEMREHFDKTGEVSDLTFFQDQAGEWIPSRFPVFFWKKYRAAGDWDLLSGDEATGSRNEIDRFLSEEAIDKLTLEMLLHGAHPYAFVRLYQMKKIGEEGVRKVLLDLKREAQTHPYQMLVMASLFVELRQDACHFRDLVYEQMRNISENCPKKLKEFYRATLALILEADGATSVDYFLVLIDVVPLSFVAPTIVRKYPGLVVELFHSESYRPFIAQALRALEKANVSSIIMNIWKACTWEQRRDNWELLFESHTMVLWDGMPSERASMLTAFGDDLFEELTQDAQLDACIRLAYPVPEDISDTFKSHFVREKLKRDLIAEYLDKAYSDQQKQEALRELERNPTVEERLDMKESLTRFDSERPEDLLSDQHPQVQASIAATVPHILGVFRLAASPRQVIAQLKASRFVTAAALPGLEDVLLEFIRKKVAPNEQALVLALRESILQLARRLFGNELVKKMALARLQLFPPLSSEDVIQPCERDYVGSTGRVECRHAFGCTRLDCYHRHPMQMYGPDGTKRQPCDPARCRGRSMCSLAHLPTRSEMLHILGIDPERMDLVTRKLLSRGEDPALVEDARRKFLTDMSVRALNLSASGQGFAEGSISEATKRLTHDEWACSETEHKPVCTSLWDCRHGAHSRHREDFLHPEIVRGLPPCPQGEKCTKDVHAEYWHDPRWDVAKAKKDQMRARRCNNDLEEKICPNKACGFQHPYRDAQLPRYRCADCCSQASQCQRCELIRNLCKSGTSCTDLTCKFLHPPQWDPRSNWRCNKCLFADDRCDDCRGTDCCASADHCFRDGCEKRHPRKNYVDRSARPCSIFSECGQCEKCRPGPRRPVRTCNTFSKCGHCEKCKPGRRVDIVPSECTDRRPCNSILCPRQSSRCFEAVDRLKKEEEELESKERPTQGSLCAHSCVGCPDDRCQARHSRGLDRERVREIWQKLGLGTDKDMVCPLPLCTCDKKHFPDKWWWAFYREVCTRNDVWPGRCSHGECRSVHLGDALEMACPDGGNCSLYRDFLKSQEHRHEMKHTNTERYNMLYDHVETHAHPPLVQRAPYGPTVPCLWGYRCKCKDRDDPHRLIYSHPWHSLGYDFCCPDGPFGCGFEDDDEHCRRYCHAYRG